MRTTQLRWFDLARHGEPPTPPVPAPPADPTPDPGNPDDGADALGDKGKQALDRMKTERAAAKAEAAAEKKRADELAAKVAEFEDRDKSDLEKATAAADRAAQLAAAATSRAVRAEVKALAADQFADPSDAAAFLDLTAYASADGEIDTDAISKDLTALLESKPHLGRPAGPRPPKQDPGQGARPPAPPTDFRTADRAAVDAELAKTGFRRRW
jgi:multidrug efflux pump subunit AcrA (membrane-fusion protein)